jgi:hypothetical protein
MKSTLSIFKQAKFISRSKAVVNFTRQDLTKKWMHRVQSKANNPSSIEQVSRLSNLVDFYSKPAEENTENIDWSFWKKTIRTEGVVDKLQSKLQVAKEQQYNVESLAAKAAINDEDYEKIGHVLRYNHDIHMKFFTENLDAVYSLQSVGDPTYLTLHELQGYSPGSNHQVSGWIETGYMTSRKDNIFKCII